MEKLKHGLNDWRNKINKTREGFNLKWQTSKEIKISGVM